MRTFGRVVSNSCMELVRQPVFLMLMLGSSLFIVLLASVPYFGLGDDPTLVKNSVLAVTFMSGLFGGIIGASLSISREIQTGTALAVLAKPVTRWQFVIGKYFGLAGAVGLLVFTNLMASLTASRMAYDAYSGVDWDALLIFLGSIGLGLGIAGLRNYVFRKPFLQEAVLNLVIMMTVAFIIIWKFTSHDVTLNVAGSVDWKLVPSIVLVFFGVLILSAIAVLFSTRFELMPTLGICYGIFLLGLVSDYFFGAAAEGGGMISQLIYTIIPNWQLYWMADAIQEGKSIPLEYIVRAFIQMVMNVGWLLAVAVLMFEDRELTG